MDIWTYDESGWSIKDVDLLDQEDFETTAGWRKACGFAADPWLTIPTSASHIGAKVYLANDDEAPASYLVNVGPLPSNMVLVDDLPAILGFLKELSIEPRVSAT